MYIASILAEIDQSLGIYLLLFILAIVALVVLMMLSRFIGLWFQAFVSGTPISLFNIIGMSLSKIPPRIILNARITSYKAGLKLIT
ncbi:MAG TPA: flotillin-like FloA family protein, partial [Rhabdochlamydiaceae bacterium]|nr:flotillin-like FloA family protein [Rhabdochlamydiaceae bacterium]